MQKEDKDLKIALDFLQLLKAKNYDEVRKNMDFLGYGEKYSDEYFIRDVNVASKILKRYPIPPDSMIEKRYDERLGAIRYTFYFHRDESKKEIAQIEVFVNKNPIVKQPITMMTHMFVGDRNELNK